MVPDHFLNRHGFCPPRTFFRAVQGPRHVMQRLRVALDLAGQARFGPDVEWIDTIDYSVDPRRADGFYAEVRKYWPALPERGKTLRGTTPDRE